MADFQKQKVQWFPGHMRKAEKEIAADLRLVDGVIEIADARLPYSSRNPKFAELASGKPVLLILNKCDLADEAATGSWLRYFKSVGTLAAAADCRSGKGLSRIEKLIRSMLSEKLRANEQRGMKGKALRLLVAGIPNTGKSSFINRMSGESRLKVADKPGVTRENNWIVAGKGLELLDTPGVLQPRIDDERAGDKLAFIGSVKEEVLDSETMALRLLALLKKECGDGLCGRYGLGKEALLLSPEELLELVGEKRGMKLPGGVTDTERAARTLLDEFRSGKLGRLTLELPEEAKKDAK